MQLVSLYPFDPTGRATANRIENQSITVIPPAQITDYSYVIPRGAPFYAESLVIKDGKSVGARTLIENVDYWCVIDFLSASTALTKRVCVGIALLDPGYSGTLYATYQAVGGNYSLADYSILEELVRERYVVKHISYEQLINLPEGFAPEWHAHEVGDMVGMKEVVVSINGVKTAIEGRQGSYDQINKAFLSHTSSAAAHTPSQIGLGNVKNYDVAVVADVTSGATNKYVTPSVLKQYLTLQKQDLSGYVTTATANLTFAAKTDLSNYYTQTAANNRYALKSDSYTKTEIDAKLNGIDVGLATDGYYTKIQSDARYPMKSDISDFIKESVADTKYATKTTLSNYYTKSEAESRYALKTASYTKAETEARYLLSSALGNYYTSSAADTKFATKTDLGDKLSTNSLAYSNIKNVSITTTDDTFKFNIEEQLYNTTRTRSATLDLSNFLKTDTSYTQAQIKNLIKESTKVYYSSRTSTVSYRSYNLTIVWTFLYSPSAGTLTIQALSSTPFYFAESVPFVLKSGAAPFAKAGYSSTSLPFMNFVADLAAFDVKADYWIRPNGDKVLFSSNGELTINMMFSYLGDGEYTYVPKMIVNAVIPITNTNDYNKALQWFGSSESWSSPV